MRHLPTDLHSTYSIVAHDPDAGQFGVGVQTHQMTVGNFVPWLAAGVGALATQALGNIRYGPMGLALLRQGIPAEKVVAALTASDADADQRQLAVVDRAGRAAAWTGERCIPFAGHHVGDGFSVQANMMTRDTVIDQMRSAYQSSEGDLAERILAALQAAQQEDGDIRGQQSAAIRIVPAAAPATGDPSEWRPIYDLRVDEHDSPVKELVRLTRLRRAQLIDAEAHRKLTAGDQDRAVELFAQARLMAPELEELAFWQALALADVPADLDRAVEVFNGSLANDPRRQHWLDLIDRLEHTGLIEREGAGGELLARLTRN